jgi:hypothetical protein
MGLDFSHKGKCIVTMHDYLDGILKEFDAAMEKLFPRGEESTTTFTTIYY